MKKHTRATPAGTPRGRSLFTRRERRLSDAMSFDEIRHVPTPRLRRIMDWNERRMGGPEKFRGRFRELANYTLSHYRDE